MRNAILKAASAAVAALMLSNAPASAQDFPLGYGDYVEMTGIDVLDGGSFEYASWLATEWRKNQEFAKSKGWISDYHIYANLYARAGEPDIYLFIQYADMPTAEESEARDVAYREFMAQSDKEMIAASAGRGEYRKVLSSMLLGEMTFSD